MNLSVSALLAVAVCLGSNCLANASPISYENSGTVAPTSTITASATGSVTGYFVGYSAGDTDEIRMVDLTSGYASSYFFVNNTTAAGTKANFGSVNAGDALSFELYNASTQQIFSSDPSQSADHINHAYVTGFTGGTLNGVAYVAGNYTYVGMEDLPLNSSDLDYNDDQFLFTDVSTSVTPEPESFVLLGTGVLGLLGVQRRRLNS